MLNYAIMTDPKKIPYSVYPFTPQDLTRQYYISVCNTILYESDPHKLNLAYDLFFGVMYRYFHINGDWNLTTLSCTREVIDKIIKDEFHDHAEQQKRFGASHTPFLRLVGIIRAQEQAGRYKKDAKKPIKIPESLYRNRLFACIDMKDPDLKKKLVSNVLNFSLKRF